MFKHLVKNVFRSSNPFRDPFKNYQISPFSTGSSKKIFLTYPFKNGRYSNLINFRNIFKSTNSFKKYFSTNPSKYQNSPFFFSTDNGFVKNKLIPISLGGLLALLVDFKDDAKIIPINRVRKRILKMIIVCYIAIKMINIFF